MKALAPIVLFVYNRLYHTKKTVESLLLNVQANDSELYIFSDGYKSSLDYEKVNEVRKFINSISGFKKINIIERDKNIGLANSVITGVGSVMEKYDKIIVMEDDLLSTRNFLEYMNNALEYYRESQRVFSVSGYTFPIEIPDSYKYDVYFSPRASSWGWGTWKDKWNKAEWSVPDFKEFIANKESVNKFNLGGNDLSNMLTRRINGKIDSWAIHWCYTHFKQNAYCLYPIKSKIQNIGADKSGTHMNKTKKYISSLDDGYSETSFISEVVQDELVLRNFRKFFQKNLVQRFLGSTYKFIFKNLTHQNQ